MPTWGIHLAIAKKLSYKLNVEKNIFCISNLITDIPNGYVIKNVTYPAPHSITHFDKSMIIDCHKATRIDIDGFYDKYHCKFNNPVMLGYYIHLLTDYYWNNKTYSEHGLFDKDGNRIGIKLNNGNNFICDKETSRIIKTNDFKLFSAYLYKNKIIEKLTFDEKVIDYLADITWMKIDVNDINRTISYINDNCDGKNKILSNDEKDYYQIFSEENMLKEFDMCIDYILNRLNK